MGYQTLALPGWGQLVSETAETNPQLMWPMSIDVFDRMRREDSQVGSVLRAVTLPIRKAKYMIDPAGAREEVVELVASDLGVPIKGRAPVAPLRTQGRFSWREHVRLALLELVYGFSFFEQVYRIENDRAHLAKLAWRPPRTISDFDIAADGGLISITQHGAPNGRRAQPIPVERLVAYVNEREGGNWVGQSLLRTAYKNWLLKDRMLRAQALTVERNGLGVPVYTGAPVPEKATPDERDAWQKSEKEAGLKLAKGFRAGEAAGASIPNGATLELKGVTGRLPDTDAPIRYHDEQIARAVLAHFLNLGTETGSWALGSTFANFFTDSLNAVAEHLVDVTQQHVVEDLVDLNWGSQEPAPQLIVEPIGSEHPVTAEAIKLLIECKAISVDDELEAHMRTKFGLPAKSTRTGDAPGGGLTDAEQARAAAETAQKVYLATEQKPLSVTEARELIRRAGAALEGDGPPPALPTPEEAA